MTAAPDDIAAYCARIGYTGAREPRLAVLQALVAAHTAAIPFENLDVLLQRPIRLDPPSLYAKLVQARRGGYCFEHNLLLLDVLTRFGFCATGLAARVRWGRAPGIVGSRTHMLLRVDLADGPHLADVGFGGLTPTAPLALAPGPEQATPHESFRLVAATGEFDLEARLGGNWASLYRFSLQPQLPVDYEVANWFTSTHPASLFVNHLIASRAAPGAATPFQQPVYGARRDGGSERRVLQDAASCAVFSNAISALRLPTLRSRSIAAIAEANAAHPSPFDAASSP